MSNLQGSYGNKSFLSVAGLRLTPADADVVSNNSRANLSQLKLNKLMEGKKWETLESFGLEELRNGFFDPVYTGYERLDTTEPNIKDSESLEKPLFPRFKCSGLKKYYKPICKYWLALFIANVLCLIEPIGKWIGGEYRYFMPLATIIHHPSRTVGVQLEISTQSVLGAAIGMGFSGLIWYVSTATKPAASNQGGILFLGTFLSTLISHWLRSTYQRLFYFATSMGIAVIFLCTSSLVSDADDLEWRLFWDFGFSYLFGILLSFSVCVLVFPHTCHSTVKNTLISTLQQIKTLLVTLVDLEHCDDITKLQTAQNDMIQAINITLSEGVREFDNQITFTVFDDECVRELRNVMTFAASPLRVLPLQNSILNKNELRTLLKNHSSRNSKSPLESSASPMVFSGAHTPLPSFQMPKLEIDINSAIYANVLRSAFAKPVYEVITELLLVIESIERYIELYSHFFNSEEQITESVTKLERLEKLLHRKIYKLDVAYKEFTKTNFFCKELLHDPTSIDAFLFLRYIRQSAKWMIAVTEKTIGLAKALKWRVGLPSYPLKRALKRLPKQCALDQGGGTVINFYETEEDVDEAFENIYNSYTSKHKYDNAEGNKVEGYVRAIDHNDFSFHTTSNPMRYKLWQLSSAITGTASKSALKNTVIITFLLLPTWLEESFHWFQQYHCWWTALIFYILTNRRNVATWKGILRRFLYGLVGIVWAFCACVARSNNPYVIAVFGGLIAIPSTAVFFVSGNTKSSLTASTCFMIITLGSYSKNNSSSVTNSDIWKNTWTTGIALLIGILLSIPTTWLIWSFNTRRELRLAVSSLLSHISQSYQSVTDRYLYRDIDDDPTEMALRLSNIREVRLYQSIDAVTHLLDRAKQEPSYVSNFKPFLYRELITRCKFLLEKLIEARISGQYFQVWENDADEEVTHALLSLRRDSVSAVIFVLFILSNCFRSKNKIPRYLPNPILSRMKLYEFINKFDNIKASGGTEKGLDSVLRRRTESITHSSENLEKTHWTEVHGMAFARAYTDFTVHLDHVMKLSREILGEESVC